MSLDVCWQVLCVGLQVAGSFAFEVDLPLRASRLQRKLEQACGRCSSELAGCGFAHKMRSGHRIVGSHDLHWRDTLDVCSVVYLCVASTHLVSPYRCVLCIWCPTTSMLVQSCRNQSIKKASALFHSGADHSCDTTSVIHAA